MGNQIQTDKPEPVFTLWDNSTENIVRLHASQTLKLLEYLQSREDWKQDGLIVGEPCTSFSIDNDESIPEPSLLHPIRLSSTQCQELLDYLEANHEELSNLSEKEEKATQELLGRVYRYILNWPQADTNDEAF